MPRIQAPTVAEHRAAQHRALVDAARQILAETGRPPTLARVAARAGLARPSLYQYFRSAEDLLNAVVEDVFPAGRPGSPPRWTPPRPPPTACSPTC